MVRTTKAQPRPFVTLLTADTTYLPCLLNWLAIALPHGHTETVLVLALDDVVHAAVRSNHGRSIHVDDVDDVDAVDPASGDAAVSRRSSTWLTRMIVAQHILKNEGTDVLMSDLDALWLRDPLPMVATHLARGVEVVASRASSLPRPQAEKWGATVCMGFVYFTTSRGSLALFGRTVAAMRLQEKPDDQVAFNEVLDNMHRDPTDADPAVGMTPLHDPTIGVVGFVGGANVTLLPNTTVFRSSKEKAIDLADAVANASYLVYHAHPYTATPPKPGQLELRYYPAEGIDVADALALSRAGLWRLASPTRSMTQLLGEWSNGTLPCGAVATEGQPPSQQRGGSCGTLTESVAAVVADAPPHPLTLQQPEAAVAEPAAAGAAAVAAPFVLFVHMPKAAGSSLSQILRDLTPGCASAEMDECGFSRTAANFTAALQRRSQGARACLLYACRGHADMAAVDQLWRALPLGAPPLLVTMLRAPVARMVSEFAYARSQQRKTDATLQFLGTSDGSHHALFEWLDDDEFTLIDYARWRFNQSNFGAINNRQSWMLAGRPSSEAEVFLNGSMTLRSFKIARYRLSMFDFFGITERFDDSVRLLLHTFVQRRVVESRDVASRLEALRRIKVNEGGASDAGPVSRDDECELARLNGFDQVLYRDAAQAFDARMCAELGECAPTRFDDYCDCAAIRAASDEFERKPMGWCIICDNGTDAHPYAHARRSLAAGGPAGVSGLGPLGDGG